MVLISRHAAARLFAEVQRWVDHGLTLEQAPYECLAYPLSALTPRQQLLSPLEPVSLEAIAEITIDDVAIPPDEIKAFTPMNCHFGGDNLERINQRFNRQIDEQISLQPRLAINSKLHSHPFTGGDFLSAGDRYHGVTSPQAHAWRQRRGLSTAILHVVYPDDVPQPQSKPWRLTRHGAVTTHQGKSGFKVHWSIRTWASDDTGALHDLGDASVVANNHPRVKSARRRPYWQSRAGVKWCDSQKIQLREAGYRPSRNTLGRGWRRYIIHTADRCLVFALPPDFPQANMRVLDVQQAWSNSFSLMKLPKGAAATRLSQLSLLKIAEHFGPPAVQTT
jgi:hypothetical protein